MRAITYIAPFMGSASLVYSLPQDIAEPAKIIPRAPSTVPDPLPNLPTLTSAAQCLEVLPHGGVGMFWLGLETHSGHWQFGTECPG